MKILVCWCVVLYLFRRVRNQLKLSFLSFTLETSDNPLRWIYPMQERTIPRGIPLDKVVLYQARKKHTQSYQSISKQSPTFC